LQPHPEICPVCHRFSKDYKTCIDCRTKKDFYLEGIIIPFAYTDLLKRLIIKLKYFHKKDIGNFLVERLKIALLTNQGLNTNIVVSFIPSHRYRHYFVKGYNQSELLARKLSEYLQVAIAKKCRHTKTQASLDRNGRLYNLKNAFSLAKNLAFTGNETLLIVDDITTTGSTINELAKLIKHYYPTIKVR
jgi:competence protein ComFC